MRESWLVRHSFLINFLICVVLIYGGLALGLLVNPFYYLLILPGGLVWIGYIYYFNIKWVLSCAKCGRKQVIWKREKYCKICGGEMTRERAKILVKYCENGHRIKDEFNLAKMCPKCGKPFRQEKVELK